MELSEDKDKRTFTLQLSSLPKVRLSSILNTGTILYKESDTIPNIQFFTVNNNLTLPKEDDFIYEGGKEVVYKALTELFNERDLYIVCSKSKDFSTTPTNVPMNVMKLILMRLMLILKPLNILFLIPILIKRKIRTLGLNYYWIS